MAGLLLGAAVFALAGCGPSGGADSEAEDLALFELHPISGQTVFLKFKTPRGRLWP